MTIELNYEGLDEATTTTLKSEAVQKLIADAIEANEKPLRATKDQLLGEKRALEQQLKEVNDLGGLEKLKSAPKLEEEVGKKTAAEQSYAEQVRQLQTQLDDMKNQNVSSKLAAKLAQEIREAKGAPELLEHHVKNRIKHSLDESGNLKVTVLDKSGVEMFVNGKEASIGDLLNEFKGNTTFARAFEAPALSGASTKASTTTNTVSNPFNKATLNITEQGRLIKSDRQRASQLASEAGAQIPGLNA